jgi:hypothetical protein
MQSRALAFASALLLLAACSDAPTATTPVASPVEARISAHQPRQSPTASARWTREKVRLFRARGGDGGRIAAYVALAQYRSVLAALTPRNHRLKASAAGAASGASAVVLKQFYPLDSVAMDALLAQQRSEIASGAEQLAFDAGRALGETIGTAVLAQAAADRVGLTDPGTPPVGPGFWVSRAGVPLVRGFLGARPFFLRSGDELRLGPPPAFGSPTFLAELAEVKSLADARTPEQLALSRKWAPMSNVLFDSIAAVLIDKHHRSELVASAILAYANTATFDALIACFDTKYAYWHIRPSQADPRISLALNLPNHPSWPSAHSCASGAWVQVLSLAFPSERRMLDSLSDEAGESRIHGGLHYRSDALSGRALGARTARVAIVRGGLE